MTVYKEQNEIFDEIMPDSTSKDIGESEIADFYAGCNVLITGASGFLGRLLVEKILRSCPDVAKIYMIMRAKKGKSAAERYEEYFKDAVYQRLKREQPNFMKKAFLVEGDAAEVNFGLSPESWQLLKDTNIVIHGAATVRFDAQIRRAAYINVRGTKELVKLAKEMENLKAFVHVSTAYSQCVNKHIGEIFYPPPITSDKLISLMEILDDDKLDKMTPALIGEWPNTYSFTKAVAEEAVRSNCVDIPYSIVRPAIIIPTSKDPIIGWINNFYGPIGVGYGAAMGLLHTLHCDPDILADMIPADYVVSLIVAVAWNTARAKSIGSIGVDSAPELDDAEVENPPIYNAVSSIQKPIVWSEYMSLLEKEANSAATSMVLWHCFLTLNKRQWVHEIHAVLFHLLPAIIVDSLLYLRGKKPMLWNAYKKIDKFSTLISYFSTQEWQFENNNVLALWEKTNRTDRVRFDFNMESLDWEDYFYLLLRCLRVYLMHDPLETLPEGQAKFRKLRIAHYTLVTVIMALLLWAFKGLLGILGLW